MLSIVLCGDHTHRLLLYRDQELIAKLLIQGVLQHTATCMLRCDLLRFAIYSH